MGLAIASLADAAGINSSDLPVANDRNPAAVSLTEATTVNLAAEANIKMCAQGA